MIEFEITDEEAASAIVALDAALAVVAKLDPARLEWRDRVGVLAAVEAAARQVPAIEHGVINVMDRLGDKRAAAMPNTRMLIAEVLRVTETDASHRIGMARELGERWTVDAETLPPALPDTAAAQADGSIGEPHVRVIRAFMHGLPEQVTVADRVLAEAQLAHAATQVRPDHLAEVAKTLAGYLNPDGKFSDRDRQRKRAFGLGKAGLDHMASGKLVADPELQAMIDLVLAKHAAPGAGVPDGTIDTRSAQQRGHDAIKHVFREFLAAGESGTHRGLLPQVIVTVKLSELQKAAGAIAAGNPVTGFANSGGGRLMPMVDLIRMASQSIQYLAVFHDANEVPLYLGRTQRLASTGQRLMTIARDKGCTFPDCNASGYWTEIHHTIEWADGGTTDAHLLTCACQAHHDLATRGLWRARLVKGRTVWTPVGESLKRGGSNTYFHPEAFLDGD